MIITGVKADNVLKYKRLDLSALPESGLIAISGPNESGKSTIGETVCFGLFGRTFSLGPDEIGKVVRWGENHCAVSITFRVEGTEYEVSRFLDKDGNHSAKLALAADRDNPIARGVTDVSATLFELLGYEFEEFVESFYLAQREITTPHPHSLAVKIMAGVAPLEVAHGEFEDEIAERQEKLDELQTELDTVDAEWDELDFREGYLIELEDSKNHLEYQMRDNRDHVVALTDGARNYAADKQALADAESGKTIARFFRFVSFLLAIAGGGVWAALTQWPNLAQSQALLALLQQRVPNWQDVQIHTIGFAGAVFAVLMLLFWMRVASREHRISHFNNSCSAYAHVLSQARTVEDLVEGAEEITGALRDPAEADDPEDEEEELEIGEMELPAVEPRPLRPGADDYRRILTGVENASVSAEQMDHYVREDLAWLEDLIRRQERRFTEMSEEVDLEMDRLRQAARLQEVLDGLHAQMDELREEMMQRERAMELLDGAAVHLSNNFNRDIRDLVSRTLPLFTEGRYEHLNIDEDLVVRVFSGEKRDFMDLEEVSSGTQRQIMLALRLALSQKLLARAVDGRQFAFLDEPFAFFDEERTRNALAALNHLEGELSQLWIVAQSFPDGDGLDFAVELACSRDLDMLQYQG